MPQARVSWTSGKQFVAESGSGHALVLDTPADIGGRNTGATPMELVLMALAGCTGVDVAFILGDRMQQQVTGIEVSASGERAERPPKVYTAIEVRYRVTGRELNAKKAVRAIRMSAENYCSVSQMLLKAVPITSHYEITDEVSGETTRGTIEHGD